MTGFILRRILQLIPVLLIASVLVWAMIYAVPGDPVAVIVGDGGQSTSLGLRLRRSPNDISE